MSCENRVWRYCPSSFYIAFIYVFLYVFTTSLLTFWHSNVLAFRFDCTASVLSTHVRIACKKSGEKDAGFIAYKLGEDAIYQLIYTKGEENTKRIKFVKSPLVAAQKHAAGRPVQLELRRFSRQPRDNSRGKSSSPTKDGVRKVSAVEFMNEQSGTASRLSWRRKIHYQWQSNLRPQPEKQGFQTLRTLWAFVWALYKPSHPISQAICRHILQGESGSESGSKCGKQESEASQGQVSRDNSHDANQCLVQAVCSLPNTAQDTKGWNRGSWGWCHCSSGICAGTDKSLAQHRACAVVVISSSLDLPEEGGWDGHTSNPTPKFRRCGHRGLGISCKDCQDSCLQGDFNCLEQC